MQLYFIEAKYRSITKGIKELIWLQIIMKELKLLPICLMTLFYDNMNNVKIANNLMMHARTTHIEVNYHFVREHVQLHEIEFQLLDILTKSLGKETFKEMKNILGMVSLNELNLLKP
jgi:hypothetical protein